MVGRRRDRLPQGRDSYRGDDVRPIRVAAWVALIATLALGAVPGLARPSSPTTPTDLGLFHEVELPAVRGSVPAPTLDPAHRSESALDPSEPLRDPAAQRPAAVGIRPRPAQPAVPRAVAIRVWQRDREVSWYGPGFYGNRTACGQALTTRLRGVAHRTLPCGTLVSFRNPDNGRAVTVPVVDRGPYVAGRTWDLTGGACVALDACRTGPLEWRLGS
jgi:rare lipoprotein A